MPPVLTFSTARLALSRRALLAAGAASLLPACAERPFGEPDRATLTRVAQDLFPHPPLSAAPYGAIVEAGFPVSADPKTLADAATAARSLGKFADLAEAERRAMLGPRLSEPFFIGFRFAVLTGLYTDVAVTRRFGYQGPSLADGGYLDRGFADLPWLPGPGAEASRWPV